MGIKPESGEPKRAIFETVDDARDEAIRRGFGMITAGTNPDRPWIKLSEWVPDSMRGFPAPRFLIAENRLYRITACYHLGYDHTRKEEESGQQRDH